MYREFREKSSTWLFYGLFGLAAMPAYAGFQFYSAPHDEVSWVSSGNRLECRLQHDIPGYGQAIFRHKAMKPMEFSLSVQQAPHQPNQVVLFSEPPSWKVYAEGSQIGRLPLNPQQHAVVMPEDWARRLVAELSEGMQAVLRHPDWVDGRDMVTVSISPLNFRKGWLAFLDCTQNLIQYDYSSLSLTEFYFGVNSYQLSKPDKEQLDKIAEYLLLEPAFQRIELKAFADSRGFRGYNLQLSKQRANAVKEYLISKGVPNKLFRVDTVGEKNPKYNNRTDEGRRKNRRVELTLVK